MNKILIIDDEVQIRSLLDRMLELEGYEVCQAGDCKAALKQLEIQSPDVALCDVFLPDGNGVDLVLNIKKIAPNVEVILLTAHGNIPDGVQAIKNGAFDYITKGDDNNKIIPLISRAVEKANAYNRQILSCQKWLVPLFPRFICKNIIIQFCHIANNLCRNATYYHISMHALIHHRIRSNNYVIFYDYGALYHDTRTYIDIITYPRTFLIRTLPHNRHIVTYFTVLTNDNFEIYQYPYASMVEKAPSPN